MEQILKLVAECTVSNYIPHKEEYIEGKIGEFLSALSNVNENIPVDVEDYAEGTYAYELSVIMSRILKCYKAAKREIEGYHNDIYLEERDEHVHNERTQEALDTLADMFYRADVTVNIFDNITVTLTMKNKIKYISILQDLICKN